MINEVNLAKMYEAYVNDGMVKAGSLKEMGFNYNDLHNLMAKGEIEKVSWGLYEVSRVDILYRYGVQLRETGDYLKARKVFLKCLDKDSNYIPAVLELMIIALREEKYEEVNDLFVWLLKVQEEYHKDIMYYLYLYGVVTEVPEIFKDYVKTLRFQDIKLEKQDGVLDIQVKNIIREYVMKRQFGKALKLWGNKEEQAVNSSGEVLESILLNKAYQKERCNSYKLNDLVKRRDYEGVNQLLEEKKESAGLTISEEWTKILVEKYLEIREGLVVPEVSVYWSRSPIEAILGNNFELAYNMTVEYQNKLSVVIR